MKKLFKILSTFLVVILLSLQNFNLVEAYDEGYQSHLADFIEGAQGEVDLNDYQGVFEALEFGPHHIEITGNHVSLYYLDREEVTIEGDLLPLQNNLYHIDPKTLTMDLRAKVDSPESGNFQEMIDRLTEVSINRDQYTELELEYLDYILEEVFDYDRDFFYAHFDIEEIYDHTMSLSSQGYHEDLRFIVDEVGGVAQGMFTFWNSDYYLMYVAEFNEETIDLYALDFSRVEQIASFAR